MEGLLSMRPTPSSFAIGAILSQTYSKCRFSCEGIFGAITILSAQKMCQLRGTEVGFGVDGK